MENNGHFFVFCADLYRHEIASEMENKDVSTSIESTEKFMVALIDAALAAQNAAVAAESLGLGICYIGGIRNHLDEVCELLKTPKRVVPLFGLAVGYPEKLRSKDRGCLCQMSITKMNMNNMLTNIKRNSSSIMWLFPTITKNERTGNEGMPGPSKWQIHSASRQGCT